MKMMQLRRSLFLAVCVFGRNAGAANDDLVVPIRSDNFFPESVAIHNKQIFTSGFLNGEILKIDFSSPDNVVETTLVEGNQDGVVTGWGLWYDESSDTLFACANRNQLFTPEESPNAAHEIDPITGDILQTWVLPGGAMCNSILFDDKRDVIYLSDVNPSASIVAIERASGAVSTWLDDPAFESDSGFGVGGLAWDGDSNLFASAGGNFYRIPIREDGSAGSVVAQTIKDEDGVVVEGLGFDGLVYGGNGKMYGATSNADFTVGLIHELTLIDEETLQFRNILEGSGFTGVDYDNGAVFAADGQIAQLLQSRPPIGPVQIVVKNVSVDDKEFTTNGASNLVIVQGVPVKGLSQILVSDVNFANVDKSADQVATRLATLLIESEEAVLNYESNKIEMTVFQGHFRPSGGRDGDTSMFAIFSDDGASAEVADITDDPYASPVKVLDNVNVLQHLPEIRSPATIGELPSFQVLIDPSSGAPYSFVEGRKYYIRVLYSNMRRSGNDVDGISLLEFCKQRNNRACGDLSK